jgi:hypothetical protein
MAYLARADLKLYLGIAAADTSEDDLLDDLLVAAQAAIDSYCDRTFEAGTDSTRYFDAQRDSDGTMLHLDEDLCQVAGITNGDDAATVVGGGDYVLLPQDPPHNVVLLRNASPVTWQGEISVTGRWAYSISAPDSIVQATREYTACMYRAYDRQGDPDARASGSGLPEHLKQLLSSYQRLR